MRILIADDDPYALEALTRTLTVWGHSVVFCTNGADALRAFSKGDFDFVITDYLMPRKDGVTLIVDIRRIKPNQKVILVSGDPPKIDAILRKDTGEFPVLCKPYSNAELLALIES